MHVNFNPSAPANPVISFEDFLKVDIRVGEVLEVHDYPEARNPSYKLVVDFGAGVGIKKSCAQLTGHYQKEELVGKKLAAVVNFPPRQIGKYMSEVLIVGFSDQDQKVSLFSPDKSVPNGSRLH